MDGWKYLMKHKATGIVLLLVSIPSVLISTSCGNVRAADPAAGLPPDAKVVPVGDPTVFTVDHPEQFPVATATAHPATSELVVTGTVTPDVSKQVPVPSLATGRIVEI